jgi:formylmethanofuran dehydrogenase subunit D
LDFPAFATGLASSKLKEFVGEPDCVSAGSERRISPLTGKRFIMNAGRTTKQGQQINIGKDSPEYQAIVNTLTMHPDDMKEVGIVSGGTVRVSSDNGQAVFQCKEGKVPRGMIFVPYGPPTCRLMGQTTDGTGMPTSKGWEVEVEPISGNPGEKQ